MSANLNSELNLTPLLERIIDNPYGVIICSSVLFLVLVVAIVFFVAKSGILSSIREHQDHKIQRINDEIKDQEKLLSDASFEKYKNQIQYHLDVSKLNKLLKYSHHDKDLLEYILSCENKNLAIFYYKKASFYLEKDQTTQKFKLKSFCKDWLVNSLNVAGTIIYFSIGFGSLLPMAYIAFMCIKAGVGLNQVPFSFFVSQFILFIACLLLALMILKPMVKPWQAKKFLELEKVKNNSTNDDE
ncbi:hypothetical protein NDN11_15295 [Acinetobacter sp. C26M]|uniref:hypothetical protein n=1 Tax=Acinetobacter TaxID=469 RepID=UPI001F4A765E|nr:MULTISPECIES: hypothetical protein [Acinetobacter]MCH7303503.1 hypothetical protein [Acinetobacter higginsii]USA46052.1 hypothetical protein NDN11_15295 [Acinetobacter sp. C26M]USA49536.1 hypothetical protein NDN12_15210 [Acinetobacter sp. C26G]